MFGKVDMEWIYPYKNASDNTSDFISIDDFINLTINNYIKFLEDMQVYKFKKIYVLGLHLPSLESNEMIESINSYNAILDVSSKGNITNKVNIITKLDTLE